MKFSIRSRILLFSFGLSIIFIMIARMVFNEVIPRSYLEMQEKDIEIKIGLIDWSSNEKYEESMEKILKIENETIKNIERLTQEEYKELGLGYNGVCEYNKKYQSYRYEKILDNGTQQVTRYFDIKNYNDVIKVVFEVPKDTAREVGMKVALEYLIIFIVIFNIIFAIFIGKVITKKAKNINIISKEMINKNSIIKLEKDILVDEFDELADTINMLTNEFNENIKKLERERLYKKQFMLSLSHEIKTPIGGLNGILEGMLDNIPPYTNRDKYIRECRKLSSRLGQIANEMLDVTKLNSVPTGNEEVIVKNLLDEICDGLGVMALSKNVEIENKVDNRITIFTDSTLFKRSAINIVENAIKYSRNGSIMLIESKGYIISFYNECYNLTEDDLQFVFNPLYRGSNREIASGRGIGLYIVQECLTALKITYKIENYEKGVVFRIDLKGEETWD